MKQYNTIELLLLKKLLDLRNHIIIKEGYEMRKICKKTGCNNIALSNGFCNEHQEVYKQTMEDREKRRFSGKRTKSAKWNYLYRTDKWKKLRKEILERNDYKCKYCGSKENLIVHHELSWSNEYDFYNNIFSVYCKSCHSKLHNENTKLRIWC